MSTEEMNTTNKQPDIAAILEALSPENRGVIEERLVTMSKAAFAASEKLGPLEEQLKAMKSENEKLVAANTAFKQDLEIGEDAKMKAKLDSQIMDKEMKVLDNLISKIGANSSFRENAPIFGCDNFDSSDTVLSKAAQVLMCCNATMMNAAANKKRGFSHVEDEPTTPEVTPTETMTPLQRAIAATWTL